LVAATAQLALSITGVLRVVRGSIWLATRAESGIIRLFTLQALVKR
jgi:hypothetical protein